MIGTPVNQFPKESVLAQTLALLERCSSMEELKQIHAQMVKTGLALDVVPVSRLLTFCTLPDSGSLAYAKKVFERFPEPNIVMWNSIIRAYSNSEHPEQSLHLYCEMLHRSVHHNAYTFPFLLKASSRLSVLDETQQIHAHIFKMGFGLEVYTTNSLLHVYAKSGDIKSARLLFDRIPGRDIVSWNSMIDGYAKCGEVNMALEIFQDMPEKNLVSWTTMISCCVGASLNKEALTLFCEMQVNGIKPDNAALASTLSACAQLGALDQGSWIHAYIDKNDVVVDSILGCVLIDMYAKCGDLEKAVEVFHKMEEVGVAIWTVMILGFAIHGLGREALHYFQLMRKEGVKPNSITFTAVLTACSHAGLVNEGRSLFEKMESFYCTKPSIEHYGCMVDLLGRAGLLKEAKDLITDMPFKPNPTTLGALLNACHIHGNIELGKQIGKILVEVDPGHGGRYVHLAAMHAAAGEWSEAGKVRRKMRDQGVSKVPGGSTISHDGTVHEFFAGDGCHPRIEEIHDMLDEIIARLKQEGYIPEMRDLLLDLDNTEKGIAIHQHSEKLAIAFGLISTKQGMTIRIVKNLRVCKDCHTVAKLVSRVYNREIVLRDRTRFHRFRDGNCSCADYW
ncbi:hypothetical protein Ancab_003949 [Ancistrocladus abbreviatus]